MNIIRFLMSNAQAIVFVATTLVTVASIITAGTETPKKGTNLYKAYKIIETVALVVGKAKQIGEEPSDSDQKKTSKNTSKGKKK